MSHIKLGVILCILMVVSSIAISPVGAEEKISITTTLLSTSDNPLNFHVEPSMAIQADGSIIAGWKDSSQQDGAGIASSYSYSKDGGKSWSNPKMVPTTFTGGEFTIGRKSAQSDAWITNYGNTLYYAYIEYNSTDSQVTIAKSNDTGQSWQTTKASDNVGFSDKETIDVDAEGNLYLVYDDVTENGTSVRLSRSFDGNTFYDNVTISDSKHSAYVGPYILPGENGKIFVAFTQLGLQGFGDICFDRSDDYGETWHTDTDINPLGNASTFAVNSETGSPTKVSLPVLVKDQNQRLYITWDDVSTDKSNENWDVYFRYSDDFGETWSNKMRVNEGLDRSQWNPEMTVDSKGNVHFLYYDEISTTEIQLKYRIWDASTQQFSKEIKISENSIPTTYTRLGEYNSMEVDQNGTVHIVWTGSNDSGLDIYYTQVTTTEVSRSSPSRSPFLELSLIVFIPIVLWSELSKYRRTHNK